MLLLFLQDRIIHHVIYPYNIFEMPQAKKKYLIVSNKKNKMKNLKNINHEISLSKLGLSFDKNGNSFHTTQLNLTKKVEYIQDEIDEVILKINAQQKRHYLLKTLVNLIKIESSKLQSQQKKSDLIQKQSYNKRIKKLHYDIDQIQQKCNQQVANISFLQEEVNAKRSQRVVFSNLFKTIELQLKKTLENYKQELMQSQVKKYCLKNNNFSRCASRKQIISKRNEMESISKRASSVSIQPMQVKNIFQKNNFSKKQISSFKKEKIELRNISKKFKESRFITEVYFSPNFLIQQKQNNTYRKNKQIQKLKAQIEKVKVHLGQDTYQSAMKYGFNLKEQNKEIEEKIQCFDNQIQVLQFQQKQLLKMKKNNEVVQYSRLPMLRRGRIRDKTQVQVQTSQDVSISQKTNEQYVLQIAKLFLSQPNLKLNDTLLKIDKAIDVVIIDSNVKSRNFRDQMRKTDSSNSKTMHHNGPEDILERMQRITQFEKLWDQKSFFQQYKRQIARPLNVRCSKK